MMSKTVVALALLESVNAFSGVAMRAPRSQVSMAFEDAINPGPQGVFDPLGLVADGDQDKFDRLRYVELKHGRICQLGFLHWVLIANGITLPGQISSSVQVYDHGRRRPVLVRTRSHPLVLIVRCRLSLRSPRARPSFFFTSLPIFFTSAADPPYLSDMRIRLLAMLSSPSTVGTISAELGAYLRSPSTRLAQAAAKAVAECAGRRRGMPRQPRLSPLVWL